MPARYVDTYLTYRIVSMLATDWKDMKAYELGIIDENGNPLKKSWDLESKDEKNAYTPLHRLVFKIKRMFENVPKQARKIATYSTALLLLKEQYNLTDNDVQYIQEEMQMDFKQLREATHGRAGQYGGDTSYGYINESHMEPGTRIKVHGKTGTVNKWDGDQYHIDLDNGESTIAADHEVQMINEVATNVSAGGKNVAGLGDEPPVYLKKRREKEIQENQRREPDDHFQGCAVFDCQPETVYNHFGPKKYKSQWKRYMNMVDDDDPEGVAQYARENPSQGIIARNAITGEMRYLKHSTKKR